MRKFFIGFCVVFSISACKHTATINAEEAAEVIGVHLKTNPQYTTTKFDFGKIKFNSKAEYKELDKYKYLADGGYISLNLENAKKKFLSKDSSYTYTVKLTDLAKPFVLKQSNDKATVKAVIYELTDEKPVDFSKVSDTRAKAVVSLKRVNTPFSAFQKNPQENSDFMTKTYQLGYDKNKGWHVR